MWYYSWPAVCPSWALFNETPSAPNHFWFPSFPFFPPSLAFPFPLLTTNQNAATCPHLLFGDPRMRSIPPNVILSWPTPNYTNPTTRGNALLIVNVAFISIAITVVGLRLYTRIWIKRWFGTDDAFIVLALVRPSKGVHMHLV